MKGFFKEFKEFAVKGNMIDMAVGIIVGMAFNRVIDTLVKKVIMPPLNLVTGEVHLSDKKWVLREAVEGEGRELKELAIGYGEMGEVALDFLIISFTIFVVIKFMNRLKARAENPQDEKVVTPKDIQLLTNIEKRLAEQNELLKKAGSRQ